MIPTLRHLAIGSGTALSIWAAALLLAPVAAAHGPHVSVEAPSAGAGVSASDVQVDQPAGTQPRTRGGACASCSVTDPSVSPLAPLALTGLVLGAVFVRRRLG